MKKSNKFCIALSVAACLCAGVAVGAQYSAKDAAPITASADVKTYNATEIKMFEKGSIRKGENAGIRFSAFIGEEVNLTQYDQFGMLFIPATAINYDAENLTVNGKYGPGANVSPASAYTNNPGALVLTSRTGYENGKFFNAVLNLTDLNGVAPADFYNTDIVARVYAHKVGAAEDDFVYFDAASRAPAYVAGVLMDDPSYTTDELYNTYVEHVEVDFDKAIYNVGQDGTLTVSADTNVKNLPVTFTANSGAFEGDVYTPAKAGEVTLTAKVAGGVKSNTAQVNVVGNERTFKNKYYTPNGDFAFTANAITGVQVNKGEGYVDVDAQKWSNSTTGVIVAKDVFVDTAETQVKLISETSGDAIVKVNTYVADITSFGENELGAEVFDHLVHAEVVSSDTTAGTVTFKLNAKGEEFSAIGFHEDYLHALYANPLMADPCVKLSWANFNAGDIGYPGVKSADSSILAQNTALAASTTIGLNRAAYDVYAKENKLNAQFRIAVSATSVTEDTTVTVERIGMQHLRDFKDPSNAIIPAAYNQHIYDVPLVNKNGLPLMTSTNQPITNATWTFTANDAGDDIANLPTYGISAAQRSNRAMDITSSSDGIKERSVVTSRLMLDENQYVNIDTYEEETYAYPFAIEAGEVITSITINGKVLNVEEVYNDGKITLNMSDLSKGHNALDVIVRYNNTSSTYMESHFKRNYRSICVITNEDLWSAMTFEDGNFNPFMSIIGNGRLEVVEASTFETICSGTDSKTGAVPLAGADYATTAKDEVYDTKMVAAAQAIASTVNVRVGMYYENNDYVLKYVPHATEGNETIIYIAPFYYKARVDKIAAVNTETTTGLTDARTVYASKMTSISISGWTGYTVYVDDSDTSLAPTDTQSTCTTSCVKEVVTSENIATLQTATKYIRLKLGTGANKIAVYDNIFTSTTGTSLINSKGVAGSWDGSDPATYVAPTRPSNYFTIIR